MKYRKYEVRTALWDMGAVKKVVQKEMQLSKDDLIKDGEIIFAVFCVLGSVVYVKQMSDVNDSPAYDLEEVLKHYRKIESLKK